MLVLLQAPAESGLSEWAPALLQFGMFAAMIVALVLLARFVGLPLMELLRRQNGRERGVAPPAASDPSVPLEVWQETREETRRNGEVLAQIKENTDKAARAGNSQARGMHRLARAMETLSEEMAEYRRR